MPVLRVNDLELYYEEAGAGPSLLLIHGLGSSSHDWEEQLAALAPHFRTIAFDLRGHGRSARPAGPYSIPVFAADGAALLRALDATPAHVVGLSLGGMIAYALALDYPALVRRLVVINSGPETPRRTIGERLLVRLAFLQRRLIVRFMGMERAGTILAERLLPGLERAAQRQTMVERWATNDPAIYLASLRSMRAWSGAARLGELRAPTLLLVSELDYTPLDYKRRYAAQLPDGRLVVIPGARHLLPVEQPAACNAALLAFLHG